MIFLEHTDNIAISSKAQKLLNQLLKENKHLLKILRQPESLVELQVMIRNWVMETASYTAINYYKSGHHEREHFEKLKWQDFATIRILDYLDHSGNEYLDLNLHGEKVKTQPFYLLWLAYKNGTGGAKASFFKDMLHLFRQFRGIQEQKLPSPKKVKKWMQDHPSGLDPDVVRVRQINKNRIIKVIIKKIDRREIVSSKYNFNDCSTQNQKYSKVLEWWDDRKFHLKFAIRKHGQLNEYLGNSLDDELLDVLIESQKARVPFFVNPYYLSLINVEAGKLTGADLPIQDYVFHSKELVEEFGDIVAWEKEDIVEPGKPNAAGWLLPSSNNVHRRYPEVAILIPDTIGRACGGLCISCQRMYDFQKGNLNFNLDKLVPRETWPNKLLRFMDYFENDTQLRDVLITGGDALMNSDTSLKKLLDAVYAMAVRKKEANKNRKDGEKYAEIVKVRLGTRLPVYLPQRITPKLVKILSKFKKKASKIGLSQFVIQTHFETAMEVTPEAAEAIRLLTSAGWLVANQLVFTAAVSRRGHTAKLRKVLNDIGVMTYYTFTVKGYMENYHNFAPNSRAVQEQIEEKYIGRIDRKFFEDVKDLAKHTEHINKKINEIRKKANIPFLATDRNVLNLPGVGKSLTFRTIGILRDGRRVLEFDHDSTRKHSPIIKKNGKSCYYRIKNYCSLFDTA